MAYVSLKDFVPWPTLHAQPTGGIGLGNMLLDLSGEKAAFVFPVPKDGTISKIGPLLGAATTLTDTDFRLETVDLATGHPSGTLWAANTNIVVLAGSLVADTMVLGTLTAGAVVVRGQRIAAVFAPAGTPNFNIRTWTDVVLGQCYRDHFTAAYAIGNSAALVGLEYSDGSYATSPGVYPMSPIAAGVNFNSGSTPDERGAKFRHSAPKRVVGARVWTTLNGDADVVLYDSNDAVMESASLDKDVKNSNAGFHDVLFDTLVSLSAGTFRRIVLKPTTATNIQINEATMLSAAMMDAWGGGQDFHHTQRTDALAWTDTPTKRPFIQLLVEGADDGVSVGGDSGKFMVNAGL